MPYVFHADFICDNCRAESEVPKPSYPEPFDTDDFPMLVSDAGECDTPCHCGTCGQPIDHTLTSEGVEYVLGSIRESIEEAVARGRESTWDRIMPMKGTGEETLLWWHGARHVEIVRDWAKDLRNYSLESAERAIVDLFLELSEKP